MRTSSEIKEFILPKVRDQKDFLDLYIGIFDDAKTCNSVNDLKAVGYRWSAACREVAKELKVDYIDETFPRSIIAYNTVLNFRKKDTDPRVKRAWIQAMGYDPNVVLSGKHCLMAKAIIETLEKHQELSNTQK